MPIASGRNVNVVMTNQPSLDENDVCEAFPHGNANAMRSDRATPGKESDSEDGAGRRRTRWLDVEDAPTCGRLVVVRGDRARVEERDRRCAERRGFHGSRFGDKRRNGGGVVAAGNGGCDLLTCGSGPGCVVASDHTVTLFAGRAVAPQFTGE